MLDTGFTMLDTGFSFLDAGCLMLGRQMQAKTGFYFCRRALIIKRRFLGGK
jgi:hypothetical protein